MRNFKQTKEYILKIAAEQSACQPEIERVEQSETKLELLAVIKDNLAWTLDHGLFNGNTIKKCFTEKDLLSTGVGNLGDNNTGFSNAGSYNAGNRNAGSDNAGYSNAGYSNAGSYNAGNRNAGYSNAGSDNAGNRNAGSYNAGYSNAGSYNAGNRNAGYSNAGSDNAGAFNNLKANYVMFNKPSIWTYEDFINSKAYSLLSSIDTTLYVPSSVMTEQEKKDNPCHITTGGYMKMLPYKECFANAWNNWSEESKNYFKELPNFDAEIFFDITGVKV